MDVKVNIIFIFMLTAFNIAIDEISSQQVYLCVTINSEFTVLQRAVAD